MDIQANKEGDVEVVLTILNSKIGQCKAWLRPTPEGSALYNFQTVQFPPAPEKSFVNAVHLQCPAFSVVLGLAHAVELNPMDALTFEEGSLRVEKEV